MTDVTTETVQEEAPRLLSPTETAKRVSMSWRTVSRQVRSGEFPAPVRLSTQRIAFIESEVSAWIVSRPRTTEA